MRDRFLQSLTVSWMPWRKSEFKLRDCPRMAIFPQSLCQAQIIILEILQCIPVVIIFAFLDLGKNVSFSDSLLGQREGISAVSQYAI